MRLLYLPNEVVEGFQAGPRATFEDMLARRELSAYTAFSFLYESINSSADAAMERLYSVASSFRPDAILWQHVAEFPVKRELLRALKALPSKPVLVYHEGDAYGRFTKRPTMSMKSLVAEGDAIVLVGLGEMARLFRRCGARRIWYTPNSADTPRFGSDWAPPRQRQFDVIVIGNRVVSRAPFCSIPGADEREELVRKLGKTIGSRFAIYGKGWERYPACNGSVQYVEQEKVLRRSWLSVGWGHFPKIPFYFSDRLPIALLSGVAHITNYQPGYEQLFSDGHNIACAHTVDHAVDLADYWLSRPRDELIALGLRGQQLARERLVSGVVYRGLIENIAALRQVGNITVERTLRSGAA